MGTSHQTSHKYSLNHSHNNYFNKIILKDLANGKDKGKDETLTGIDQKVINQRGLSQMVIEVMLPEMIEVNKGVSDVVKRDISKGTA